MLNNDQLCMKELKHIPNSLYENLQIKKHELVNSFYHLTIQSKLKKRFGLHRWFTYFIFFSGRNKEDNDWMKNVKWIIDIINHNI